MSTNSDNDHHALRDAIIYLKGEALRLGLIEVEKTLGEAILQIERLDEPGKKYECAPRSRNTQ